MPSKWEIRGGDVEMGDRRNGGKIVTSQRNDKAINASNDLERNN